VGAEYLPLIRSLMDVDAPIHLFGGFAEDALLAGSIRRQHDDVDYLVPRDRLEDGLRVFDELGFERPEIRFEPSPGMPLVMGTVRDGLNLELSVVDVSKDGTASFSIPDEVGRLQRVLLPLDMFSWPRVELEGVPVRTISPLALYQIRAGIAVVGSMGPLRPKDKPSQAALRERFFPGISEERLLPAIEPA
jgi:hypothetical protein